MPYEQASFMGLAKFKFESVSQAASSLSRTCISSSGMAAYNVLWHSAWFLSSSEKLRSNWLGFLQCSTRAVASQKLASTITFLPIIDLGPSDESCIYSAQRTDPCVTFDQPLWLKGFDIIHAENLPVVCRLGGFYSLMSFLGSVGAIMKESGLEDLLSVVYTENSVMHLLSGKAVSRAIRGHLLVESSLISLLLEKIKEKTNNGFEELNEFYDSALDDNLDEESLHKLAKTLVYKKVTDSLATVKAELSDQSRTSQLWLLYMHIIYLMKAFIFVERKCNWELHLDVVSEMLNLFAATGHTNYAKNAHLYVQEMRKLPEKCP